MLEHILSRRTGRLLLTTPAVAAGIFAVNVQQVGLASAATAAGPRATCTVTLAAGATSSAVLTLANGEVLCDTDTLTNTGTISVVAGGSAMLEVTKLVNEGTIEVPTGTTLELTAAPANLVGTTLTGGSWEVAGTLELPGAIATLDARLTLSGSGEIEDTTNSANAVDSLATIEPGATFTLDQSAYLQTGSVTSAGTAVLGTDGNSSDAVNWQDSGTFTMTGGSFAFLDPNSCINVGPRAFDISGGKMSGFGMLTGSVTVSGSAVFAPTLGGGVASFWLNGSYAQTGGTFEDTVSDPSGTATAGSLWLGGGASLGGTLLLTSSGDKPSTGTSLQIMNGSAVTGSFAAVREYGVAGFSEQGGSDGYSLVTTANTPPSSPRIGKAVLSHGDSATVSWTAPASDGGAAVTAYIVLPEPGCACRGRVVHASPTSAVITGLHPGTCYVFVVEAANSIGTGVTSARSNAVVVPRTD